MNETQSVSIAGLAFRLDSEAYRILNEYLERIERGYRENPDGPEIVADIESRVAELILGEQDASIPVGATLIQNIIDQLGYPDDLLPDNLPDPMEQIPQSGPIAKRMYRNPDGAKLGGVCSGLAAYFGCEVLWIRLAFCSPIFFLIPAVNWFAAGNVFSVFSVLMTVSVLLYLILWLCIPKAKSPRQRLEMQGKPVTAASIRQVVREDTLNDASPAEGKPCARNLLSEMVYMVGRVVLFVLKLGVLLVGIVTGMGAVAVLVLIVAMATKFGPEILAHLQFFDLPSMLWTPSFVCLGLAVLAIPLLLLSYGLFSILFGVWPHKRLVSVSGGIWIILVVMLAFIAAKEIRQAIDDVPTEEGTHQVWIPERVASDTIDTLSEKIVEVDSLSATTVSRTESDSSILGATDVILP